MKCPECNSENVRFREARNNYICDDYDRVFPEEESMPQTTSVLQQDLKKYDIFISYRRKDYSILVANYLHDYLVKSYDRLNVSLDTHRKDNLGPGDWLKEILRRIETCHILYLIITKETFDDIDNIYKDSKYQIFREENDLGRLYKYIDENPNIYTDYDILKIEIVRGLKRYNERKLEFVPIKPKCNNSSTVKISPEFNGINSIEYDIINEDFLKQELGCPNKEPTGFGKSLKKLHQNKLLKKYAKLGCEITAVDLYYDSERAKPENGFDVDFYIERKIDSIVRSAVLNEYRSSFIFITGLPGSGKTRALLETCLNTLKDEYIIVLNKDNIQEVSEFIIEINKKGFIEDNSYYLICDQIADVLSSKLTTEGSKAFLQAILNSNRQFTLVASNTETRIKEYIKGLPRNFGENSKFFSIPILSEADASLKKRLKNKFDKDNIIKDGKTIADFIPKINDYLQKITNRIKDGVDDNSYLQNWFRALQLVATFRTEQPLFLALHILLYLKPIENNEEIYETKLLSVIKKMIDNNILYLYNQTTNLTIKDINDEFIDFNQNESYPYDGETFINVLGKNFKECTFELNELVIHYLQNRDDNEERIIYKLDSAKFLKSAMEVWYSAFKNTYPISSLRRILPRIPKTNNEILDNNLQDAANKFVENKLDEITPSDENLKELQFVYALLIGRLHTEEKVYEKIEYLKNNNIIDDTFTGDIIGELYRFAEIQLTSAAHNKFIDQIREHRSYLNLETYCLDETNVLLQRGDLYGLRKELDALTFVKHMRIDFSQRAQYIDECLNKVNLEDISTDNNLRVSVDNLLTMLVRYSDAKSENLSTIFHILKNRKLTGELGVYPSYSFYSDLAKQADGNAEKCKEIIKLFFLDDQHDEDAAWVLTKDQKQFFGGFIAKAIVLANSFAHSSKIYEFYLKGLGDEANEDAFKILCMAINACTPKEYLSMREYVLTRCTNCGAYTKKVLVNKLMQVSPSHTDALSLIKELPESEIDSYALSQILSLIKGSINLQNAFVYAYEVINHPKLRKFVGNEYILNQLYSIVNDTYQENYVDQLLKQHNVKKSREFYSIQMLKPYRTLEEAKELYITYYKDYYKDDNIYNENYNRYVDLFSTLVSKWEREGGKDDSIKEFLQKEVNQMSFYDIDVYFIQSQIKLGVLDVYNANDNLNEEFSKYIKLLETCQQWCKIIFSVKDKNQRTKLCKLFVEERKIRRYPIAMNPDYKTRTKFLKLGVKFDHIDEPQKRGGSDNNNENELNNLSFRVQYSYDRLFEVTDNKVKFQTNLDFNHPNLINAHWWSMGINYYKQKWNDKFSTEKSDLLFLKYVEILKQNVEAPAIQPGWIMYKHAYNYAKAHQTNIAFEFDITKYIEKIQRSKLPLSSIIADMTNHLFEIGNYKKVNLLVNDDNILKQMDFRAKVNCFKSLLRNEQFSILSNKFSDIDNQYELSIVPLGTMSIEQWIMRNNPLRSRWYFGLFMQYYFDVYKTIENIIENKNGNKMTILHHIRLAYKFDKKFKGYLKRYKSNNVLSSICTQFEGNYTQATNENAAYIFTLYKEYIIEDLRQQYYYCEKKDDLRLSIDLKQKLEDKSIELTHNEITEALCVFKYVFAESKELYDQGITLSNQAAKKEQTSKERNKYNQEAIECYYSAADLGNCEAMFKLSKCYEKGYGVEKDMSLALAWMKAAADAGHWSAFEEVKRLEKIIGKI